MSEVYIHYGNLEDSIAQSKKVRSEISGYVEEIKRRVTTPISNLSGSDSSGYASTASSLAWQKISDLNAKASRYSSYESSISTLVSTAKTKDNYVSSQIETISDLYLTERNWFQKAGDAIYNFFCVDLANKWGWTRTISDAAKWVGDKIDNVTDKISDWFKYGDGKYVANMIKTTLVLVGAVATVVAAIVALPVTGAAAIALGIAKLVCAGVGLIITMYNWDATMNSNAKALQLAKENPGAARYYGNIDSLSEKWNRTDMGGEKANAFFNATGKVVDGIKVVADIGKFALDVASLGLVRDFRFSKNNHLGYKEGYDLSWNNIKRNILHDMKFYTSKVEKPDVKWTQKVKWDKVLDPRKWFGYGSKGKYSVGGELIISEELYKVFDITSKIKTTGDTVGDITDLIGAINDPNRDIWEDLVTPIIDLSRICSFSDKSVGYLRDAEKKIESGSNWFKAVFETPDKLDKETIQGWFDDAFEGTVLEQKTATVGWGRF